MKKLLWILLIFLLCALLAASTLLMLAGKQNAHLQETDYILSPDALPAEFDGFVIAQISDYHGDGACRTQLLDAVRRRDPDIIAITGDIADPDYIDESLTLARALADIAPVYYVTGNHEAKLEEEDFERLISGLSDAGVTVLRDESAVIEYQGASIHVVGVDDPAFRTGAQLQDLCTADGFTLLLSHRPEYFERYVSVGVQLALTGHAHGGQFRIPGIGRGLYAPGQGLLPNYTQGVHTEERTIMVVSRGIGNTYFPPRLFNPPELVCVTLRCE